MRRLSAAIVVSVTSHAAALGWLVGSGSVLAVPLRHPRAREAPPLVPSTSGSATESITLVLLEPGDPREAIAAGRARPGEPPETILLGTARPGEQDQAIVRGGTPPAEPRRETGERHGEDGAPARSPWLTMRRPERPELQGPSEGFVDDFLSRSKPLPPPPDIPDERLANEIAEARRELRHGRGSLAHIVALQDERAREELKPSAGGTFTADKPTFTAKVDRDGQVHLEDKPWQLDTQDHLMLRMGIDPYARNKLALLDRTRDQRAALGERSRHDQLARAGELVQRSIDRLWATERDPAARKRGLFELWDDCAETGSDELVAAGSAARAIVIGAIRARLRDAEAYTAAELAQLNAIRHSKSVFAPYE